MCVCVLYIIISNVYCFYLFVEHVEMLLKFVESKTYPSLVECTIFTKIDLETMYIYLFLRCKEKNI